MKFIMEIEPDEMEKLNPDNPIELMFKIGDYVSPLPNINLCEPHESIIEIVSAINALLEERKEEK